MEFSLFVRTALGPAQSPIQLALGVLTLRIKWLGRKADHSPPSSAQIKNVWSYTSTAPVRLRGVVLSEAERKVYLYFIIL
jgi:hypothetical protein